MSTVVIYSYKPHFVPFIIIKSNIKIHCIYINNKHNLRIQLAKLFFFFFFFLACLASPTLGLVGLCSNTVLA